MFFSRVVVVVGLVIIVAAVLGAIFAPVLAPYDPNVTRLDQPLQRPSHEHWLGTDDLGRDTLSRLIYGTRTSLIVGVCVVLLASAVGTILGGVAGYYGKWAHAIIMRIIDALMCFPPILLALVIAALLGGGMRNLILALTASLVPVYARLICGQVLTVKQNDYVLASRATGAGSLRTLVRHVLNNCLQPLIVMITIQIGATILAEAGLSFLGVGIQEPTAAWGSMVSQGRNYLTTAPELSFIPGVAIMLLVFAFNMVGDGLRDALDPQLRGML